MAIEQDFGHGLDFGQSLSLIDCFHYEEYIFLPYHSRFEISIFFSGLRVNYSLIYSLKHLQALENFKTSRFSFEILFNFIF